ncbi:WG repeat-containing protein [Cohnella abietis]|uniref:Uncharacterized protein n=1 Tax=Cohnella abietis TaxID=2507935 RepID=A0A3T1CYF4_9BACL|nr:WG repeat-containing protein [Cohnella abietis]BBI30866.1 hypothetical protein KCTCHS21_02650 [Cohnella abietis]
MFKRFVATLLVLLITMTSDFQTNSVAAKSDANNNEMVAISAGSDFYVSLTRQGTVWSWGNNELGQLGDGTELKRTAPVQVDGLLDITALSAGKMHVLALQKDGSVWAWGSNRLKQLGIKDVEQSNIPVKVQSISDATGIAAGEYHSVVLKRDGTVWAWGLRLLTPMQVTGLSDITAVAATSFKSLALNKDGSVWEWSMSRNPREDRIDSFTVPQKISDLSNIIAISISERHALALKKDGTVWAWGSNYVGQLGDGTNAERSKPVKVKGLSGVIAISSGEEHSIALKSDGTVWGWGANNTGQVGVPMQWEFIKHERKLINYSTPVKVNISGITAIGAGETQSFAIGKGGVAWGWGDGLAGINRMTEVQSYVIDPQFESASSFSDGVAYTDRGVFINQDREKVMTVPDRFCRGMYVFENGISVSCIMVGDKMRFGLFDKNFREIVKPQYEFFDKFVDGLAAVYKNGKWGFIDRNGKEVVKPQYEAYGYSYEFLEGLALVSKNGKMGYIDKTGKVVIPLRYDYARSFSDGLAAIMVKDKFGYIDKNGKIVIQPKYDEAYSFGEGVAIVYRNGWLLIDKSGKETKLKLNWQYEISESDTFSEGLLKVKFKGKYGFMNKKGELVVKAQYESIDPFIGGVARISKSDPKNARAYPKYGFVDKKGKEIIPAKYDYVGMFSEGLADVRQNGKWGFVDQTGKVIVKLQFDDALSYSEGLAAVKVNGKWGYIRNPLHAVK